MFEYRSINPATGEALAEYPSHSNRAIASTLSAADVAFREWRNTDAPIRSEFLNTLAGLLRKGQAEFARLMAVEMGKPLTDGEGEIEKCARLCEFYAEHGPAFMGDEEIPGAAARSFVSYRPLGIVFAIMPWNFPFWQAMRAAVPAIAAGTAVLLKHAPNVGGCALALESAFQTALKSVGETSKSKAFVNLFANLFVSHEQAGAIIDHELVRGVTFTGSTAAGRSIAGRAGAALKPAVLELGGSD
ncbi:MAG: aldehyde dehydrogenase family protein, partial [Leptospirales bacterium]